MSHRAAPKRQWTDEPLGANDPDDLGRQSFVETVVRRIELASRTDPSTVFGLVGPWGSGKSSVIAKVRAGLSADWAVGDFTPWASGDSASMALEFVNTIAALFDAKMEGETRQKIAHYAGYVSPLLAGIPMVGQGVRGSADELLTALGSRPPWHQQFASLSKNIQSLNKRVLIVVDDVDRLGGDELLTLLRVVRLLGRFIGVHYLIAYDQQTVQDLLSSTGSVGRSAAFMEKIVQYPFEVPPVSQAASIRLLNEAIKTLLTMTGKQLSEQDLERATELVSVLAPHVETPRAMGRFAEQLRSFAEHVNHAELDVLDYVAITWLRLASHEVWALLANWHGELASGKKHESITTSVDISADDWEQRIARASPSADAPSILRVLAFLFPGVDARGLGYHVAHERALSDSTYFGRYMLLALPEDDVSDELTRDVIEELSAGGSPVRADELQRIYDGDTDVANLAVSRSAAARRTAATTSSVLLEFLSGRLAARRDDLSGFGAPRTALRAWIAREVAIGVSTGACTAVDVIKWFGEDESFLLVLLASRIPEFRDKAKQLAEGFATYWLAELKSRSQEFLMAGSKVSSIADMAIFARGKEADGMLDFAVVDFESYLKVARAFVNFERWVGSDVSYSMSFRRPQFLAAVSPAVRARYLGDAAAARTQLEYDLDDWPSPSAPEEVIDAFVIDSLDSLREPA